MEEAFATSDVLTMEAPIKFYNSVGYYSAIWSKKGTDLSGTAYYTWKRTYYDGRDSEELLWNAGFVSAPSNEVPISLDFLKPDQSRFTRSGLSVLERVQQAAKNSIKEPMQ